MGKGPQVAGAWQAREGTLCPREVESHHRPYRGEPHRLTLASEASPGFCVEAGSGRETLGSADGVSTGQGAEVLGVQRSHILHAFQTESRPPALNPSLKPGRILLSSFLIESPSWHSFR